MAIKKKSRKFSKKKSRKLNKKKSGRGTRFKRVMRGGDNIICYDITYKGKKNKLEDRKIELKIYPYFTRCQILLSAHDKTPQEECATDVTNSTDVSNSTILRMYNNEENLDITTGKATFNLIAQTEPKKTILKQLYNDLEYVKLFMDKNKELDKKTSDLTLQKEDIDSLHTLIEEARKNQINSKIISKITERLENFKILLNSLQRNEVYTD